MTDLAEHIELVLTICGFVTLSLISLIVYLWKLNASRITNSESDRKAIWKELNEIKLTVAKQDVELARLDRKITEKLSDVKTNYIDRFDDIKGIMSENHIETIEKIGEISNQVIQQQQYCKLVQDAKKTLINK
jgi:uncharacterized coiled-coil protein SlyX